jgi:hypothetical protein
MAAVAALSCPKKKKEKKSTQKKRKKKKRLLYLYKISDHTGFPVSKFRRGDRWRLRWSR